jgi:hypothetical protein
MDDQNKGLIKAIRAMHTRVLQNIIDVTIAQHY